MLLKGPGRHVVVRPFFFSIILAKGAYVLYKMFQTNKGVIVNSSKQNNQVKPLSPLELIAVIILATCAVFYFGSAAVDYVRARLQPAESAFIPFGEERIVHIPNAFERWSPGFKSAWEDFKSCVHTNPACDSADILKRRDAAIAADWPKIFDRLVTFTNWGEYSESAIARNLFFGELMGMFDNNKMQHRCTPIITFRYLPATDDALYSLDGYNCSK